jgi:anion-transporting  ArsA/GET3 family ATPase
MMLSRVIFITGKGGTGKSTIAAALALALARRSTTTLIDLGGRRSAARLLSTSNTTISSGVEPPFEAITPRGELENFVNRIVPLKAIARRMLRSSTFGFVTAALPGLEAFLIVERLKLMANETDPDRILIVDGPATGSAFEMLSVASNLKRLAPRGALHQLALEVEEFLNDRIRFGVLMALTPEELAVRETIAAIESFVALGIRCIAAVINRADSALFSPTELARLNGIPEHRDLALARQVMAEKTLRAKRRLARAHIETVELPMLFRPDFARAEIEMLAESLEGSMLAR